MTIGLRSTSCANFSLSKSLTYDEKRKRKHCKTVFATNKNYYENGEKNYVMFKKEKKTSEIKKIKLY